MANAGTAISEIDDPIDMTAGGFPKTPEADMALYVKGFFISNIMVLRQLLEMKGHNIPLDARQRIEAAVDRIHEDAGLACNGIARHMTSPATANEHEL